MDLRGQNHCVFLGCWFRVASGSPRARQRISEQSGGSAVNDSYFTGRHVHVGADFKAAAEICPLTQGLGSPSGHYASGYSQ